jgi:hypothetical protein
LFGNVKLILHALFAHLRRSIAVENDWVRLAILLSVLLLLVFPFAGLAPLALLLAVAVCGWLFQLLETIFVANDAKDAAKKGD